MSILNFRRVLKGPLVGFFKIQDGGQDGRQIIKNGIASKLIDVGMRF